MHIHIFGASGSGVTTLGRALAAHLDLPYFDSDDYFWYSTDYPFTSPRPAAQRNALIRNALIQSHPGWILGGSIYRYGDKLQTDPVYIKHHQQFLAWCADYDHDTGIATRTLNAHEAWLKKQPGPALQLREDLTVAQRLDRILAALPYNGKEK